MASVTQNAMKLFRGSSSGSPAEPQIPQKLTRRSSGLSELARVWASETPLCVLDLGSTSPTNITFFTERGHKIYSEDLLAASTEPTLVTKDEQGNVVLDSHKFLAENLVAVMARLWSVLKPGGMLLAFFHTKDAGPDSPCCRFHIVDKDTLEMLPVVRRREARPTGATHAAIVDGFRLQRVFNNRHIENLFRDFASIKFFLARDNVREVLVVR
jgi:hypothetical protein